MRADSQSGALVAMEPQSVNRACWPIVWLWIVSIVQYGYRYILQVNDPRTSHLYGSTPGSLSALKYEIFLLFVLYTVFRFSQRPVLLKQRYRILVQTTGVALMVLAAVLLVRICALPGNLDETLLCGLQLAPWMTSVLFVPFVVEPEHSITQTLKTFERISFWLLFPFWLTTVMLAMLDIRYPALSYPGVLVRYGGIMDDPNGYACLCLLLLVLAVSIRVGAWKWRTTIYAVMLIGTLSISGYATAVLMCVCWLMARLAKPGAGLRFGLAGAGLACVTAFFAVLVFVMDLNVGQVVGAVNSIYSAKSSSARMHISDLSPRESILEDSSIVELLCGSGGFSENFYWRILANFGLAGLLVVVSVVLLWSYYGLWRIRGWRGSMGIWGIGVLVGSNGIAYLLVFPLNLIYWSALGLLIYAGEGAVSAGQHRT